MVFSRRFGAPSTIVGSVATSRPSVGISVSSVTKSHFTHFSFPCSRFSIFICLSVCRLAAQRENEFCRYPSINVFCGTFNVAGRKHEGEDLSPWLGRSSVDPDIYAVGCVICGLKFSLLSAVGCRLSSVVFPCMALIWACVARTTKLIAYVSAGRAAGGRGPIYDQWVAMQ